MEGDNYTDARKADNKRILSGRLYKQKIGWIMYRKHICMYLEVNFRDVGRIAKYNWF